MNEETLFAEALSRPPGERVRFLEEAAAGQPELRKAVEALLASHEKSGNLLDEAVGVGEETVGQTGPSAPPTRGTAEYVRIAEPGIVIGGRYTLQEKIGEGGMGEVWVAKQNEPVKRKVALKLIKTGMDSRAVLQRFEQERQALALMDHPNIAKVLDGGLTPTGQPFFVMELVNGLALTKFCDEARLTPRDRLELFVPICQAVQHAHQKGVVHRDLKPANVLVTMIDGKPVPKVIDFGVAKATVGKLTDESLSTQFGAVVGTLEYMSPEQAAFSGEDIDTRADIYSLGVILYELLTGLRPLDAARLRKAALTEMVRIIREVEPSKPSTRLSTDESLPSLAALRQTDPRRLMALLRGELDWVVMKCLEKQRERRYETANALARDIQRYLVDEPVDARPPSPGYRFGKFLRRNRGRVIAASLVLLSMLGGLFAVVTVQSVANARLAASLARETRANVALAAANSDLTRSRAAVQARYNLAVDAIKTFHTGVSEDFLLKEDKFKDLRDRLLKSASEFYGKLGVLLKDDTDATSRRALSEANQEVAHLAYKVGRKEDALAIYRQVLAGRQALAAIPGAAPELAADVARSHMDVGMILSETGVQAEALESFERAKRILQSQAEVRPAVTRFQSDLSRSHLGIGDVLRQTGRPVDALVAFEAARAIQQKLVNENPTVPGFQSDLARSLGNIGGLQRETGKPAEALASYEEALSIRKKLADSKPTVTSLQRDLAISHNNLAVLFGETGKRDEALMWHKRARAIEQRLVETNPAVTQFQSLLAASDLNIGTLLSEIGRTAEALEAFEKARLALQKLADANPAVTETQIHLAASHNNIGAFLNEMGKPSEAIESYQAARLIQQNLANANPSVTAFQSDLARTQNNIGWVFFTTGKLDEALQSFEAARAIQQRLLNSNPSVTVFQAGLAQSYHDIGWTLYTTGNLHEARNAYESAIAIRGRLAELNPTLSPLQGDLADSHLAMGLLRVKAGEQAEALADFAREEAIRLKLVHDNPALHGYRNSLANCHTNTATLLLLLRKAAEARARCEAAVSLREVLVRDLPEIPRYRKELAESLLRFGQAREALGDLHGAAADWRRGIGLLNSIANIEGEYVFYTACCHAGIAGLAGLEGSDVPASAGQAEADRAMALLRKSIAMGYRDPAVFRSDSILNSLRGRQAFKTLIEELEQKSPARMEKKS